MSLHVVVEEHDGQAEGAREVGGEFQSLDLVRGGESEFVGHLGVEKDGREPGIENDGAAESDQVGESSWGRFSQSRTRRSRGLLTINRVCHSCPAAESTRELNRDL